MLVPIWLSKYFENVLQHITDFQSRDYWTNQGPFSLAWVQGVEEGSLKNQRHHKYFLHNLKQVFKRMENYYAILEWWIHCVTIYGVVAKLMRNYGEICSHLPSIVTVVSLVCTIYCARQAPPNVFRIRLFSNRCSLKSIFLEFGSNVHSSTSVALWSMQHSLEVNMYHMYVSF